MMKLFLRLIEIQKQIIEGSEIKHNGFFLLPILKCFEKYWIDLDFDLTRCLFLPASSRIKNQPEIYHFLEDCPFLEPDIIVLSKNRNIPVEQRWWARQYYILGICWTGKKPRSSMCSWIIPTKMLPEIVQEIEELLLYARIHLIKTKFTEKGYIKRYLKYLSNIHYLDVLKSNIGLKMHNDCFNKMFIIDNEKFNEMTCMLNQGKKI